MGNEYEKTAREFRTWKYKFSDAAQFLGFCIAAVTIIAQYVLMGEDVKRNSKDISSNATTNLSAHTSISNGIKTNTDGFTKIRGEQIRLLERVEGLTGEVRRRLKRLERSR